MVGIFQFNKISVLRGEISDESLLSVTVVLVKLNFNSVSITTTA